VLDPAKRRLEISNEGRKGPLGRGRPGDQHVVGPRPPVTWQDAGRGFAQPSLRAVAGHGITDFSGRREPNPHARRSGAPTRLRCCLQNQTRSGSPETGGSYAKEIGPDLKLLEPSGHRVRADCERPGISRGQTLAALCAARRQNPAACHGCHPRPEPVATLANELARLVSALHGTDSDYGISLGRRRLYSGAARVSQRRPGCNRGSKALSAQPA
jgi:hypothetical protein